MDNFISLTEICEVKRGSSITRKSVITGSVPVVAAGRHPAYFHNSSNRNGNIITVSCSGAYAGFVNYFSDPIFASNCFTIESKNEKKFLTKYIFFYLKSRQQEIYSFQSGSAQPNISFKDLVSFKIPYNSLEKQCEIVEVLEEIQNMIEKHLQSLDLLRTMGNSLFYEIFNKSKLKKEKIKLEILKNIVNINPKNKVNLTDKQLVTFIPMSAIDAENAIINKAETRANKEIYNKGFSCFKNGDVLFSKISPCMQNKKSAIASNLINNIGYGSTEFYVLRPTKEILSEYLLQFLRTDNFIESAKNHFTGTAGQQRIPLNFLANIEIPIPPMSLQILYREKKKEVDELLNQELLALQKLEELLKSTLYYYFPF